MKLIEIIFTLLFAIVIGLVLLSNGTDNESTNQEDKNIGDETVEDIGWNYLLIPIGIITVFVILAIIRFYNKFRFK